MKFLIYSSGVILVFLFLVISSFFLNWNSYYVSNVLKQIEDISGDVVVKGVGNVTKKFMPHKIIINNLSMEGHDKTSNHHSIILVDQLELKISFLSVLFFSPKINAITINGLNVPLGNFVNLFNFSQHKNFNIKTLNIINSVIHTNYDSTAFNNKSILLKNCTMKTVNNAVIVNGLLNIGKNDYNLAVNVSLDETDRKINANIYSPLTKVTLSGIAKNDEFDGVLLVSGNNFSQFVNDFSETNKTSIFSFIDSQEEFSLSSDIKLAGTAFKLNDVKISANSLEGAGGIVCSNYASCDANIDFSKVDVDHLLGNSVASSEDDGGDLVNEKESRTLDYFNTLISENLHYKIKVGAKEIKYRDQVSNNLIVDCEVFKGKVSVNKMALKLPGYNNLLYIEGNIGSNDLISSFRGKLNIVGDDFYSFANWLFPFKINLKSYSNKFSLHSDLYIAPRVFSLSNVEVLTDSFGDVKGQLKVKYDKKSSFIVGNIALNNIDFDKYNASEELELEQFMSMKWLRGIKYKIELDASIRNFVIQKQHVNNLSFLVNVTQGNFGIDKIRFNGVDGSDLDGFIRASVKQEDLRPKISVNFRGNKYNAAFVKLPSLIRHVLDESNRVVNIKWSNKDLKFYGLEHVDGNIDINIKNFVFKDNSLIDFVFSSSLKDSLMSINKLMFKIGEGFISTSGKIGIGSNTSSLSAVISIANVQLHNLLRYVNIDNITGNVSISGSIQTHGQTLLDWINALDGKMEMVAKGVNVVGVDFNKFIIGLLDVQSKSDIAALTQIGLYKNNTLFDFINAGADIKKGHIVSSLQFAIDNASGVASANISLLQFTIMSKLRLSFIPSGVSSPSNVDMLLQGQLWQPKIKFDVNAIYEEITKINTNHSSSIPTYQELVE